MAFEGNRDKNGEISRKHGNTLIGTLRKHYDPKFAKGCGDRATLGHVREGLEEVSLSQLVRDDEAGKLERICRET